jgi:hypothetical protein
MKDEIVTVAPRQFLAPCPDCYGRLAITAWPDGASTTQTPCLTCDDKAVVLAEFVRAATAEEVESIIPTVTYSMSMSIEEYAKQMGSEAALILPGTCTMSAMPPDYDS